MSAATKQPQRRATRQRQLVLDEVRSRCDHPTADAIYQAVHAKDAHVSRGTVYRNLGVLADEGEILAIHLHGGDRYDLRVDDHAHLVCLRCGVFADAELPYDSNADSAVTETSGFTCVRHATTFYGLCPDCQRRPEA